MHRRTLLKLASVAPMLTVAGRLAALPQQKPRLLVVFLRGGYDAANLLVPIGSSFYYEARPTIAVARPSSDAGSALPLNAEWGLHPALRDSIYPLWQKQQVAFVPFAGTDDLSRSHFETQDNIEMGQSLSGTRNFESGFLGRVSKILNGAQPIAFTEQLPLILRGEREVPNMALKSLAKPALDERQSAIIAAMYRQTSMAKTVNEGFDVRADVMHEMSDEMEAASRSAINTKGFELEARRMAKLMRDKFNIGFVDVGGWDTHVGEGAGTGYLAGRFEELGRGLASFADAMGPVWKDTVVVVVSEFGRTFRENGNHGTDHGHGTVYWVMGGNVRGGRIAGDQARVDQPGLFQNRDYPVMNEFRAVLGGTFARMYGLSSGQVAAIFPGATSKEVGLI